MDRRFFFKPLTAAFVGAALALGGSPGALAEDIDIFTAGSTVTSKPNVLIILDNSSNWSSTLGPNSCNTGNTAAQTKFAAEVCALQLVVDALPAEMRLGLMMFAETGINGGYVRFGIRDLTAANKVAYKKLLGNMINNGSGTDNSSSNQPYALTIFEAWKYFGGGTGTAGSATGYGMTARAGGASNSAGARRRDYPGNVDGGNLPTDAGGSRSAFVNGADTNYALSSSGAEVYSSPIVDNCAKNFIIFISNGDPGTGGDSGADTVFTNIGGNPAAAARIKVGSTEVHASLFDEFARHFYQMGDINGAVTGNQKLITYTIAVYQRNNAGAISAQDQRMIKLMDSGATVGGGKPFLAENAQDIVNALLKILNEVQAVNSVFVSASLPVSVNTQGTFLNQVYMGLFRPEGSGSPRWVGNVKEYKFVKNSITGDLNLADSTNALAVNPTTGFISPSATSFWTSASTFWTRLSPTSPNDKPDGDVVQKGGAAQVVRKANLLTQANRNLYTCPAMTTCPTNFSTGEKFNNTNITFASHGASFNAANATDLSLLVNWVRGEDNAKNATLLPFVTGTAPCDGVTPSPPSCTWDSAESGPGWTTTVRPSLHGDVLHSRPVVLNYVSKGANTNVGPHLIYAAGDGVLRVVKGGTTATDGEELWSFIAPEFFPKFRRLRYADPELRTPGTPPGLIPSTAPKDYFFDGPIGVYEDKTTTPETKWIFVGARRGGNVLYAFDVSIPSAPKFKWKVKGGPAPDLPFLGQTWSLPIAFKIGTAATDPIFLVFGAGYDPGEDNSPATSTGVGRGIYVLNADTGAMLAFHTHADMKPVPSDMGFLAHIKPDGTVGNYFRGYVGDVGGNVWRLDLETTGAPANVVATDPTTWVLHKFAELSPSPPYYKFLYAPDLVRAGNQDMVLLGSGDREKPLVTTSSDRFFGLRDPNPQFAAQAAGTMTKIQMAGLTPLGSSTGFDATSCGTACKGWYREMAVGEKVVNSPLTVAGITFFATNKPTPPAPGSCESNLGEARTYGISFLTGGLPPGKAAISTVLIGGGLAPSPVGGVVDLGKADGSEGGETVAFCIGCGKEQRLDPERPNIIVPTSRQKIYWNLKTDG